MNRKQTINFLKKAFTGSIDESLLKPETLVIGRVFLETPGSDIVTVIGSNETFTRQEVQQMKANDKATWITFK